MWCLTWKLYICDFNCVYFNMYYFHLCHWFRLYLMLTIWHWICYYLSCSIYILRTSVNSDRNFIFLLFILQVQVIWTEVQKWAIKKKEMTTKVWVPVKTLHYWNRQGSQILIPVWQVIMLVVNAKMTFWQRRRSLMIELWNHLNLQVCQFRCQSYSFLTLIISIYDVDYGNLWKMFCMELARRRTKTHGKTKYFS